MGRTEPRQAAVLDVGCHSALLQVARWQPGAGLKTVYSYKVRLRLHEALDREGRVREAGIKDVERAVTEALAAVRFRPLPEAWSGLPSWAMPRSASGVFPFATSVIRDAPNRDEVIARVARATGTRLRLLPGEEEARLAYVAARRWTGSAAGPLLMLDIGGGTVEIASGLGEQPHCVLSLPLGARRITRDWFPAGTARPAGRLEEVREHVDHALSAVSGLRSAAQDGRVVACSKTFQQLARLVGAPTLGDGPRQDLRLTLPRLRQWIPVLADADSAGRSRLPGISRHRAGQSLAGALIAEALLVASGVEEVDVCPWSTREGLLMEGLGVLSAGFRCHLLAG